jgi:hypothetical protein
MTAFKTHEIYELRETYLTLQQLVYDREIVGGNCHIVVDDGNIKNHHIMFCIDCVVKDKQEPTWFKHIQYALLDILLIYPESSPERNFIYTGETPVD